MKSSLYKQILVILMLFGQLAAVDEHVTVGFVGDVMLGRTVSDLLALGKDYRYVWGNVLPLLQSTDFVFANLETALTRHIIKTPKVFNFRSDPDNANALTLAHIQAVNIANNHILDFGIQGLIETLRTLDKNNIVHGGAGITLQEAQKPAFITKNNIRFGIIGFTDNEPEWSAGAKKPGTNYIKIDDQAFSKIKNLIVNTKKQVDFLIVSLHWGFNWTETPPQNFQRFARQLIDAGVDFVHGHSAHIFQAIEIYKNKLIIYGAGDFLDDYAVDEVKRNDQAFLFLVTVNKKELCSIKLVPTQVKNMQVNRAKEPEKIINRMRELSKPFGTAIDHDGHVILTQRAGEKTSC